jgi:hypothetical protein
LLSYPKPESQLYHGNKLKKGKLSIYNVHETTKYIILYQVSHSEHKGRMRA